MPFIRRAVVAAVTCALIGMGPQAFAQSVEQFL